MIKIFTAYFAILHLHCCYSPTTPLAAGGSESKYKTLPGPEPWGLFVFLTQLRVRSGEPNRPREPAPGNAWDEARFARSY
jgi:hypothetical protein